MVLANPTYLWYPTFPVYAKHWLVLSLPAVRNDPCIQTAKFACHGPCLPSQANLAPKHDAVHPRSTVVTPLAKVHHPLFPFMSRVGQNRIYAPYMTVYLVVSLPKTPYIHIIFMVLAKPSHADV